MAGKTVRVGIWHGDEIYMTQVTENDIKTENVPGIARILMDRIYLRLDDQIDAAKLRAHRRRLKDKHRGQAVGQIPTTHSADGGRAGEV